jgi:hypothetical protein
VVHLLHEAEVEGKGAVLLLLLDLLCTLMCEMCTGA